MIAIGLAVALGGPGGSTALDEDALRTRPRVLLLYTESRILPAVVKVDAAIRGRFAAAGVSPEFFTEYLDLSWAVDPRYAQHLLQFLRAKHGDRRFDVVIPAGAEAFRFALAYRETLFPGAPIIFCAVPPGTVAARDLPPDVTGVWMTFDGAGTIEAARGLQPRARQVVIVSGAAPADRMYLDGVKRQLAGRLSDLDVVYLEGLPLESVSEHLGRLARDTIVFYLSIQRDGAGRTFAPVEALRLIAPASKAPIYISTDTLFGPGIVGGRVLNFETQGTQAADIALRLLRGDPAWRVPPVAVTNTYVFDAQELGRWGFREADLPAGSVVANRTQSFWEHNRGPILAALLVIGLEALLIAGLFVQVRRRRRAEAMLQDRLGFERLVSDLTAVFVNLRGTEFDLGVRAGLRRVGEHLGLDRVAILQTPSQADAIEATYVWHAPGTPAGPPPARLGEFPWSVERIRRGEMICFSRLSDLPEAAAVDRQSLAVLGVTSGLAFPLLVGGTAIGALTLRLLGREREWPDDLVRRLEFVAGIFASALVRYRNEVDLEQLRRDLSHVGRVASAGELASSLAHELNQPLAAILANAQAAQRMLDGGVEDRGELRAILGDIVGDDRRAAEIIHRLRSFIRKDETYRSRIDVNTVVQEVVGLVRNDAIIRSVALDLKLEPGLPPVFADRVQLQQVLLNLLINALDALGEAGVRRIAITSAHAAEAVQVAVRDWGPASPRHTWPISSRRSTRRRPRASAWGCPSPGR